MFNQELLKDRVAVLPGGVTVDIPEPELSSQSMCGGSYCTLCVTVVLLLLFSIYCF